MASTPKSIRPRPRRVFEIGGGSKSPVLQRLQRKATAERPAWYFGIDVEHSQKPHKTKTNSLTIRLQKGKMEHFPYRLGNKKIPNVTMDELHIHMALPFPMRFDTFRELIEEVHRILKPGGRAYFSSDGAGIGRNLRAEEELEFILKDPRFRVRSYWFDPGIGIKEAIKSLRAGHGKKIVRSLSNYFHGHGRMLILFEKRSK